MDMDVLCTVTKVEKVGGSGDRGARIKSEPLGAVVKAEAKHHPSDPARGIDTKKKKKKAARSGVNLFEVFVEFGQGNNGHFFESLMWLVGSGRIRMLASCNKRYRSIIVTFLSHEYDGRRLMVMDMINPRLSQTVTHCFEAMMRGAPLPPGMVLSNFYAQQREDSRGNPFFSTNVPVKEKVFTGFLGYGDMCIDVDLEELVRSFCERGWYFSDPRFYGVSVREASERNGELEFTLRMLFITNEAPTMLPAALDLLADRTLDVSDLPLGGIWEGRVAVRIRKSGYGSAEVVSITPEDGSLALRGGGEHGTLELAWMRSLEGLRDPRRMTERLENLQKSVGRMLAGCGIPPDLRINVSVVPLGNILGLKCDNLAPGTVVLVVVGNPRSGMAPGRGEQLGETRDHISVLAKVQGDGVDGFMKLEVLRLGKGVWTACFVDGRPVILSESREALRICLLDVDPSLGRMCMIEDTPLVNVRVHPDFVENWNSFVLQQIPPYVYEGARSCHHTDALRRALGVRSVMCGLGEMMQYDMESVERLFDGYEQGPAIGRFLQVCLKAEAGTAEKALSMRVTRFVHKLLDRVASSARCALETICEFVSHNLTLSPQCVEQFAELVGQRWRDVVYSASLYSNRFDFLVYAGDSEFPHFVHIVQTCIPDLMFLMVRDVLLKCPLDDTPKATAERMQLCLKWCFERDPSMGDIVRGDPRRFKRYFEHERDLWTVASKLQKEHQGLYELWTTHFRVQDVDEMQLQLNLAMPDMQAVLEQFRSLKSSISGLAPRIEAIKELARKRGMGGSASGSLPVDFGQVELFSKDGSRTLLSMDTAQLMELVGDMNKRLEDYSFGLASTSRLVDDA